MADLTSILSDIRGLYSDRGRDQLPDGAVWELTDYIPEILQAGARGRGAWVYMHPDTFGFAPKGMIYAPFAAGSKLIVVAPGNLIAVGSSLTFITSGFPNVAQNPVFHRDRVIIPFTTGIAPWFLTWNGTAWGLTAAPASAPASTFATVWRDRLVVGGGPAGIVNNVYFSKPGDPTAAWDSLSVVTTGAPITGLGAVGNSVLCMHDSSVQRLRGSVPPDSTLSDPTGDLILDTLSDRFGCYDARSIAYWNENVLFCDARGITLTDGASVRNLVAQAGIQNLWRSSWTRGGNPPYTTAAVVFRDYYIVTIVHTGLPPLTIVVDLSSRRVFQFSNIDAFVYAYGAGASEQLFAAGTAQRTMDLTAVFNPDTTILQVDGDGTAVLPLISTAWSTLTKKVGFKRIHDVHLTYEAHRDDALDTLRMSYVNAPTGANQVMGEFPPANKYVRRKLFLRRRLPGVGLRLEQLVSTKDTRLYDISVRAYPEEESYL